MTGMAIILGPRYVACYQLFVVRRRGFGPKVIHQHKVGDGMSYSRVSELTYFGGKPYAVLAWITNAGIRAPAFSVELDAAKLVPMAGRKGDYLYQGRTVDPRYEPVASA